MVSLMMDRYERFGGLGWRIPKQNGCFSEPLIYIRFLESWPPRKGLERGSNTYGEIHNNNNQDSLIFYLPYMLFSSFFSKTSTANRRQRAPQP